MGTKASVIVPIYNQYDALKKVLNGFAQQSIPREDFEMVIIDDGSQDNLKSETSSSLSMKYDISITLVHQMNCGRAVARNVGIAHATSDIAIFCDGDRIPNKTFLKEHLNSQMSKQDIVIGSSYDFFGRQDIFSDDIYDFNNIEKYSRLPSYFKRVSSLYSLNEQSRLIWLSLLIGNASIKKQLLTQINGFDEQFKSWGFEHFELGLRLYYQKKKFYLNQAAKNYHLVHSREKAFYSNGIDSSIQLMKQKYSKINEDVLRSIFFDNDDIARHENDIFVNE